MAAAEAAARDEAEAEYQRQELAKKARFDRISTVTDLSKCDFRAMRMQPFFSMQRTTKNPHYWRKEQELIMTELYATLRQKVCDQTVLNLDALNSKNYFKEAVWVLRKLGLEELIGT